MAKYPRYRCFKEVEAVKIKNFIWFTILTNGGLTETRADGVLYPEDDSIPPIAVSAEYMNRNKVRDGGYYVRYKDGYESFSPAEPFEEGYALIDESKEEQ